MNPAMVAAVHRRHREGRAVTVLCLEDPRSPTRGTAYTAALCLRGGLHVERLTWCDPVGA